MAAPYANRLNLTRDQLATFLSDHEQIKQFERLFALADSIAPDVVAEINIATGSAQATADQALGQIESLDQELSASGAVTDAKATAALNHVASLAQESAVGIAVADGKASQALALLSRIADAVEGLQTAPVRVPAKRTRYGQFLDTTTQLAVAINTPQAITYNTTDISQGVFLRSPSTSEIAIDTEGLYNFQFSIQLDKTAGGTGNFWIWPRLNGTDVPNSASQVQIQGNNSEIIASANFFLDLKAGDYVEFMFAVSVLDVELKAFAASAFVPAIPSIIVTVSNNIRGYP